MSMRPVWLLAKQTQSLASASRSLKQRRGVGWRAADVSAAKVLTDLPRSA
jgi:hypothetical protein